MIGIQLCTVLDYLHVRRPSILHLDLKPTNVVLRENGMLSLIDFGIAQVMRSSYGCRHLALGTPGYAAPEQYCGSGLSPRSDLYSLGVTLYQLLTGTAPSSRSFHLNVFLLHHYHCPTEIISLLALLTASPPPSATGKCCNCEASPETDSLRRYGVIRLSCLPLLCCVT